MIQPNLSQTLSSLACTASGQCHINLSPISVDVTHDQLPHIFSFIEKKAAFLHLPFAIIKHNALIWRADIFISWQRLAALWLSGTEAAYIVVLLPGS